MSLVIEVGDDTPLVLTLAGELDAFTSRRFGPRLAELLDAGHLNIVLDLADLDFIDSTALGVLIAALKRARRVGGDIRLRGLTPAATKVFDASGLSKVFDIN